MEDVEERIKHWATDMGYDSALPYSFHSICNPSTAHIWDQLMANSRPKQTIEKYKKLRLIQNNFGQGDLPVDNNIRELQVYRRKQELLALRDQLQRENEELKKSVEDRMRDNNKKYLILEQMKCENQENVEKTTLLSGKIQQVENVREEVGKFVEIVKNVTPVEPSSDPDYNAQIKKTLDKCVEKLECILRENAKKRNLTQTADESLGLLPHFESDDEEENFLLNFQVASDQSDPIFGNQFVKGKIQDLLHERNHQMCIKYLEEDFHQFSEHNIRKMSEIFDANKKIPCDKLLLNTKVYYQYLKGKLDIEQIRKEIVKLKRHLEDNPRLYTTYVDNFNLLIRNRLNQLEKSTVPCAVDLNRENRQLAMEIREKQGKIIECLAQMETVEAKVRQIYENFHEMVQRLHLLCQDGGKWAEILQEDLISEELENFSKLSLDFVKKRSSGKTIKIDQKESDESLFHLLYDLLNVSVGNCVENVLIAVVRMKEKFKQLEMLQIQMQILENPQNPIVNMKRDLPSLEFGNELGKLMESVEWRKILDSENMMRTTMDLWLKMPFKQYVSGRRIVEGHNYQYYERKFNNAASITELD